MKSDSWPKILTDFLVAASLLTRLPLPHLPDTVFDNSARTVWAYPLAGILVGGLAAAGAWSLLAIGMPAVIAAGVLLAILMITTGAMHEDGLADVADGFWGGYTPERRLEIMKDSQIGTFGTLALVLTTGLRWAGYSAILQVNIPAVIAIAAMSRAGMPLIMAALPHARESGLSHSVGKPSFAAAATSALTGLAIATPLVGWAIVPMGIGALLVTGGVAWLSRRKISGQTGDVLGSAQQISEVILLMAFLTTLSM